MKNELDIMEIISLDRKDVEQFNEWYINHPYCKGWRYRKLSEATRYKPAEVCGIQIEGENKWITLIQNAMKNN